MFPEPRSLRPTRSSLDPKSNILVNNDGRACLAGFSPPTLTSDQPTVTLSSGQGGTVRWMAPEILTPERFDLTDSSPTEKSDCYSLGMVMYEVLSREIPFSQDTREYPIIHKVLRDERPERPRGAQGAWFRDGLWEVLELCWKPRPGDRPSLDTVFQCLQDATPPPRLPSDVTGGVETGTNDQPGVGTMDLSMFSLFYPGLIADAV